jgi:tetratricopeptide (TPR) repeat protein
MIEKYDEAIRIISRAEGIEGVGDTLLREKARCYAAKGDKREAAGLYADILKKDKKHIDALLYCARAANEEGTATSALSYADRLLKVAPNHREGLLEKAKSLNTLKKYNEALACLNTLLSGDKPDPQAYVLAGGIYAGQNDDSKAIELYAQYLTFQPKDATVLLALAKLQTNAKQYRGAAESYQTLFMINNRAYKDQMIEAGMLLEKEKDLAGAKAAYQKLMDAGLYDEKVALRLARITFQEQGYQQTSTLLRKIPENDLPAEYKKMLGVSYFKTDLDDLALPLLETAFKKEPEDKQLIEMLAQLYEKKQNYKKASALFSEFLASSKTGTPDYAYKLGLLYEKQTLIKDAMKRYADNIKQYPDRVENYEALCRLYIEQKNYAEAQALLAQSSNLPGSTSLVSKMHGQLAAATGKPADAILYYSAYLTSNPKDTLIWCDLFDIHYTMKNTALALEAAENAGSLITANPQYFLKLGSAYHEIGKCEQAVPFLEKVREKKIKEKRTLQMLVDCYKALNIEQKLHNAMNELSALESEEKKK